MVPNHQPDFVCPILGIDAFPCSFSQLKRRSIENLVLLVWEVNLGSGYIIGLLQAKIYIHNFTGTPEPPCISWGKKNGKPWFLLKIFPSKRIHCHHVWPWPGLAVWGSTPRLSPALRDTTAAAPPTGKGGQSALKSWEFTWIFQWFYMNLYNVLCSWFSLVGALRNTSTKPIDWPTTFRRIFSFSSLSLQFQ